jgi:hypothetical protein|tara:strand:+ start:172 stop:600 length:429 start_codon:yes stop_codon:yes gene_type:complete
MNNISYTVLKLSNGEDIICEVDFEQYDVKAELPQRVFEIQNPLLMIHTKEKHLNEVHEGLSLSRWVQPYTEQKYFSIPATSVVTSAEASPGLARYYEYVLKRIEQDIKEMVKEKRKELENYTNDEIYDELLEETDTPSKSIH